MMVSLSNVLTVLAVIWIIILVVLLLCETKTDAEIVVEGIMIIGTILSAAVVLYRIGSLIFLIIGG